MPASRPRPKLPFSRVAFVMHSGWHFLFQRAHHFAARFREAGVETVVFELSGLRSQVETLVTRSVSREQRDTVDHLWSSWYPYRFAQRLPLLETAVQPVMERSFRRFSERWLRDDTLLWLHGVNLVLPPQLLLSAPHALSVVDICDDFAAFYPAGSRMQEKLLRWEQETAVGADIVLASAARLSERLLPQNPRTALVRNGVSAAFIAAGEAERGNVRPGAGRRFTVGYQGAFADWFDFELVEELARLLPDVEFRLLGRVYAGVRGKLERLTRLSNVRYVGLVPHEELPRALAQLDVGLIPFRINDLTLATDPIKLYEYLGCGVPVAATPMPEVALREEAGVVRCAGTAAALAVAIRELGAARHVAAPLTRRLALARANSWDVRFEQLLAALCAPAASRAVA